MLIHECPLLQPEILSLRPVDRGFDPTLWKTNEECSLGGAAGELILQQGQHTASLALTPGSGPADAYVREQAAIWVMAKVKRTLVGLRCARPSGLTPLTQPLDLGVDQRVADDLHQQRRIAHPLVDQARDWLADEFLCAGKDRARAFALTSNAGPDQLQLIGRATVVDFLRNPQGQLLIQRIRPRKGSALDPFCILEGDIQFADVAAGLRKQGGAEKAMLEAAVTNYGTYLQLWQRYSDLEWRRELGKAAALGALNYSRCEPASAEGGAWRFWATAADLADFKRNSTSASDASDFELEAGDEAPDWRSDRFTDMSAPDPVRRFRGAPRFEIDSIVIDQPSPVDPPERGYLYLSLGGNRKQQERRFQARRAIEAGLGVPNLRRILQNLPISGQRPSRFAALTAYAKDSFRPGRPTAKQEEAIRVALNTPDIALIIGPPGTGKTQVIAALERRLAELNEGQVIAHEVLISSFQHDAVQNALERTSVYGLPAIKVGQRAAHSDALDHWCAARAQSASVRLAEIAASEPHVPLMQELERLIVSLRIVSMDHVRRSQALARVTALVDALAQGAKLRTPSSWRQDWNDYLQRADDRTHARVPELGKPRRMHLTRLVRAIRTLPEAYADDGCLRLKDLLEEATAEVGVGEDAKAGTQARPEPGLISAAEVAVLHSALQGPITSEALAALCSLRSTMLDRLRPDSRPAMIREQLDSEGATLLAQLQAIVASKASASRLGRYGVMQRYRDAFDANPRLLRSTVEEYSSIVGATCQQAAGHQMSRLKSAAVDAIGSIQFNTVIIDEAARANPLDLFIPMAMAKRRIVLVGDHRQLPHLLDPEIEDDVVRLHGEQERREVYRQSMFERLWRELKAREEVDGFSRVVTLDTQFRMHPVLGSFISKHFYENASLGKVNSGRNAEDFPESVPVYGETTCLWIDVPARLGREETRGPSKARACEAKQVAASIMRLLRELPAHMSVGAITFYAAQRELIYEELARAGAAERDAAGWKITAAYASTPECAERLRVGTVDAFQGKEFDVVFLSAVRSNDLRLQSDAPGDEVLAEKAASRKYGHLRTTNRLNVAMSRQRRLLIGVGEKAMFTGHEARQAVPEMAAFLELCESEAQRVR